MADINTPIPVLDPNYVNNVGQFGPWDTTINSYHSAGEYADLAARAALEAQDVLNEINSSPAKDAVAIINNASTVIAEAKQVTIDLESEIGDAEQIMNDPQFTNLPTIVGQVNADAQAVQNSATSLQNSIVAIDSQMAQVQTVVGQILSYQVPITVTAKSGTPAAAVYNAATGNLDFTLQPGPQGLRGPQGDKGDIGDTGAIGPKGDKGDPGLDGQDGQDGTPGATGSVGPAGATGPQGDSITPVAGVGNPGLLPAPSAANKGNFTVVASDHSVRVSDGAFWINYGNLQGDQGPQGPQGVKGDKGEIGDRGPQGLQGVQGQRGDTGATGLQGIQGVKGDTGSTGTTGKSAFQSAVDAGYTGTEAQWVAITTGALQKTNNLSDVSNASLVRTNLGLGGAALLNVGTASGTVAAGNDSRLSTIDGKTGGTVTGNTTISGTLNAGVTTLGNTTAPWIRTTGDLVVGTTGATTDAGTLYIHGKEYILKNNQYHTTNANGYQTNGIRVSNQNNALACDYQLYEERGSFHEASFHLFGANSDIWFKMRNNGELIWQANRDGKFTLYFPNKAPVIIASDGNLQGDAWGGSTTWLRDYINAHGSDRRIKDDIKPVELDSAKQFVKTAKTYEWKYKQDGSFGRGIIADEVDGKLSRDTGTNQTLNLDNVRAVNEGQIALAYLTPVVKDLMEQVELLKAEVTALKK